MFFSFFGRVILQHAAFTNLDDSTSFFGVYDGHGGKHKSILLNITMNLFFLLFLFMMSDDSSSEGINTGPLDHWVYTTKKTKAVGLQFWLFMSLND